MPKCVECEKTVSNRGVVYCEVCDAPLHNRCAEWIAGCIPFCSDCYSEIEYTECPDCHNDTLAVWPTGSSCDYCHEHYGPGVGFKD